MLVCDGRLEKREGSIGNLVVHVIAVATLLAGTSIVEVIHTRSVRVSSFNFWVPETDGKCATADGFSSFESKHLV